MREFVFVLGAPRTGSSCLSGCIYSCGVDLGASLSTVKDRHNERGYFENEEILNFNRAVFRSLGFNWHDRDLTPAEERDTLGHKDQLLQILETDFTAQLCAIKDFRLGIFADLYIDAITSLNTPLKVVVINRSGRAVKASMRKMFGWKDDVKADWIYKRCYQLFDKYTCPRLILTFEDLLDDPLYIMGEVCRFIGVDFDEEKQQKVTNFVETGLVHESSD